MLAVSRRGVLFARKRQRQLFAPRDQLLQLPLETRMAGARGLEGGLLRLALDFQAMHAVARRGFLRARLFHRVQQGLAVLLQLRAPLFVFAAGGLGLAQQIARGGNLGLVAAQLFADFILLALDLRAPRFELRQPRLLVSQLLAQLRAIAVVLAEIAGELVALVLEILQLRIQLGEFGLQVGELVLPSGQIRLQRFDFTLAQQPAGARAFLAAQAQPVAADPGAVARDEGFARRQTAAPGQRLFQRFGDVNAFEQRREIDVALDLVEQRRMRRGPARGRRALFDEGDLRLVVAGGRGRDLFHARHAHGAEIDAEHPLHGLFPAGFDLEHARQARRLIETLPVQPFTQGRVALALRRRLQFAQRSQTRLATLFLAAHLGQLVIQLVAPVARLAQPRFDFADRAFLRLAGFVQFRHLRGQGVGRFFFQLRADGRGLLFEARLALAQLFDMAFQLAHAGGLDLAHPGRFGRRCAEGFPFVLPVLHGALGLGAALRGGVARAGQLFQLRRQLLEPALQFFHARHIRLQMLAGLAPGAVDLFLLALLVFARLARVLDGLLEARNLGADGIELGLHRVELVHRLGLLGADFFDLGFDAALLRQHGVQRRLLLRQQHVLALHAPVEFLPAQHQQLRARQALFLFQFLVARRGARLPVQLGELRVEFLADVVHARQVLARVLDAALGLATAFLVFGNARGLFQETAQVFRLGLDDARDHALLDDRVGARSQAGAEEDVGDVLAPALGLVEEVVGLPVAPGLAPDGNLGILGVLAAGTAFAVVENELDRGHAPPVCANWSR